MKYSLAFVIVLVCASTTYAGIFFNRATSSCPSCANGQCTQVPAVVTAPIPTIPPAPVAAKAKAVPANITQDLAILDTDTAATTTAQTAVTNDTVAMTSAQAQLTADSATLATAQAAQAVQLAKTVADIQAAYGPNVTLEQVHKMYVSGKGQVTTTITTSVYPTRRYLFPRLHRR